MATVRREAPRQVVFYSPTTDVETWLHQAILDLAEGRHAKDCECDHFEYPDDIHGPGGTAIDPMNACLTIAKCARDLIGYDVEVGDASV